MSSMMFGIVLVLFIYGMLELVNRMIIKKDIRDFIMLYRSLIPVNSIIVGLMLIGVLHGVI